MASERVPDVMVRRHMFESERPFQAVLGGIFGGISRPDMEALFAKQAETTSYEQFSDLFRQARGSAGLMLPGAASSGSSPAIRSRWAR